MAWGTNIGFVATKPRKAPHTRERLSDRACLATFLLCIVLSWGAVYAMLSYAWDVYRSTGAP